MSKKILVADDSVVIQKSIGITFAQEDFQVTFVGNGEEALQRAKEIKPDLILADTSMPKLSGVELCKKIRLDPDFSKTPIILLSNFQETFTDSELKTFGANDFIQKPFESTALLEKIRIVFTHTAPLKTDVAGPSWESVIANPIESKNSVGAEEDTAVAFQLHQAAKANDDHQTIKSFNENINPPTQSTVANLDMLSIDEDGEDSNEQNEVDEFASFEAEPLSSTSLTSSSPSTPPQPSIPTNTQQPQLQLSDQQIEQIVAKVFQNVIEKIAWEVVPDLAERIIKEEIRKISQDT